MKKTCKLFAFFLIVSLYSSCFRLDDNLFNYEKTDGYYLDNYTGDHELDIGHSYDIPDSLIHIFTLDSQNCDECSPDKIYAIYIGDTSRIATDTVFLYLHGNRGHMDVYWERAKLLANAGGKNRFGVMMIDYRGYGLSEGTPTEEGLYADANAAQMWLEKKGLIGDRLIHYGYSLGTAPATELAATPRTLRPGWLILESPFASADVMVTDAAGLNMPGSFYVSLKINVAEDIKKVNQPFLWMHGTDDSFLNIKTHGEVVYKNYLGLKGVAYRVEGAEHNNVPTVMGYENYLQNLSNFIVN